MAGQRRPGAISLRSHLLAGTAAMVTAAAVTVSGVTASGADLPSANAPIVANVELAAYLNPLLEIFDTVQKTNLYLFSIAEPPATAFDRAGIIPATLASGLPALSQLFLNGSDYVNKAGDYLFRDLGIPGEPLDYPGALRILTWAVDALPANLGVAFQELRSGDLVDAFDILGFAIANPIQAALYQVLNAGLYVLGGVGTRAAEVITAVADWIPTTIRNLADDVTVVLSAVTAVARQVLGGIQLRQPELVWNALVRGLLGTQQPSPDDRLFPTIPDALINQTIGEGSLNLVEPTDSIRQNLIGLNEAVTEGLAAEVPVPEAPPFYVAGPGFDSAIPTPWAPTPFSLAQVQPAAAVPAVEAPAPVSVEQSATAVSVDQPAPAVDDTAASVQEPAAVTANTAAESVRPSRASRGAVARAADAPEPAAQKPSRQAGARSSSR